MNHRVDEVAPCFEVLVVGERRVVTGTDRALPLVHVAGGADAAVEAFAGLCGKAIAVADDHPCGISGNDRRGQDDGERGKDGETEKPPGVLDRKSTRLNSSHVAISYAGFRWP